MTFAPLVDCFKAFAKVDGCIASLGKCIASICVRVAVNDYIPSVHALSNCPCARSCNDSPLSSGYGLSFRSKRKPQMSVSGTSSFGRWLSVGMLEMSRNVYVYARSDEQHPRKTRYCRMSVEQRIITTSVKIANC